MITKPISIALVALLTYSCVPELTVRTVNTKTPDTYYALQDTTNNAKMDWATFFQDENLTALIDSALANNQELNIVSQEVEILRNEVTARKGEYLPRVDAGVGVGLDKVGRYTRNGALEANNEIRPGKEFPEPLGDFTLGLYAEWEIDIWRKLRNAKKSAFTRYLSGMEGRNFLVTNLIAEIANSYYELLALDNQLELVRQNIAIQSNVLDIVRLQKQSARVTELAVKRFEAQLLDTRSLQFGIQQDIVEVENRINFLVGRFPQPVQRSPDTFNDLIADGIQAGIPAQLLENRPDVRQAELELVAAKLDVQVAKATFYPSLGISAGVGLQSFDATELLKTPESLIYSLAADMISPLVNRKAIVAAYQNANAAQLQAVVNYEQTLLRAYFEVANQLANIDNLRNTYDLKAQQVQALTESIDISTNLFRSARADYMEVLLTQEEALISRLELIETKMGQIHAWVNVYRALGGGWQ